MYKDREKAASLTGAVLLSVFYVIDDVRRSAFA